MAQIQTTGEQYVPLSVFADVPMLKLAPEDFPNQAWSDTNAQYNQFWSYYKGFVLNQKAKDGKTLVYPVKLNIIRSAVIGHASVLLGQFTDRIVSFGISDALGIEKSIAQETTKALNMLWSLNNGDSLLLEQALFQQIFGGFFWKVAWAPTRKRWPIRYFTADPRACFPVWDGDDYDRLVSIDVQHQIPKPTAEARFRVPISMLQTTPEFATINEHWDENEYYITVDGVPARWPDGSEMKGPNPFFDDVLGLPVIPYVYVPRMRIGEYYGESLVPGLIGPQNELNNNLAHLIEGLADAMHQQPWVRNRPKGTKDFHNDRSKWLDLGMPQMGAKEPEVGRLDGAELTEPMISLVTEELVKLAREHVNLPDIAFGRTDASVRSALTMAFMLKPVTDVGAYYRMNASRGMKQLGYVSLVIANSKQKLGGSINGVENILGTPIKPQMVEAILMGHKTNWPPMLPDDRAELVNEIVQRLSAGVISVETAIRRLDGSDELQEELDRIEEDTERKKQEQLEMMEKQAELAPKPDTNGSSSSKKQPSDRTNKAQAAGGRAKGEGK